MWYVRGAIKQDDPDPNRMYDGIPPQMNIEYSHPNSSALLSLFIIKSFLSSQV